MCLKLFKRKIDVTLGLQPPWITYSQEIEKFFEGDDEVVFHPIDKNFIIKLESSNTDKILAITKILNGGKKFGSVKVNIETNAPLGKLEEIDVHTYETAFKGNKNFSKVEEVVTPYGIKNSYVIFSKSIIQFQNDDLSDYYGNFNAIVEDVARDIFVKSKNLSFSTEIN